jgi:hypothetical protein
MVMATVMRMALEVLTVTTMGMCDGNGNGNSNGNSIDNDSVSVLVVVGWEPTLLSLLDGSLRNWRLGIVGAEPRSLLSLARIQCCHCWRRGNVIVIARQRLHIPCWALAYRCHWVQGGQRLRRKRRLGVVAQLLPLPKHALLLAVLTPQRSKNAACTCCASALVQSWGNIEWKPIFDKIESPGEALASKTYKCRDSYMRK